MSSASAARKSLLTTNSDRTHVLTISELDHQNRILGILFYGIFHFFGDIRRIFSRVTDPRRPGTIRYKVGDLAFAAILMFLGGLGSRRQIGFRLRDGVSAQNFRGVFNAPNCPHGDTINDAFASMDPEEFQAVLCRMVYCLIRSKALNSHRLLDRHFVIAIDGTWTLTRKTRHCPWCLTKTINNHTTYYHMVLEAKLVTPNGFAIPILTEFVENDGEESKQDCELKAFYRLADRLKAYFPRLPILLTLDSLFAGGPVFAVCAKHNWKFMVVHKDGKIPTVAQEFEALSGLQPENRLFYRQRKGERGKEQRLCWVNDIEYTDTAKTEHKLSVIECIETQPDTTGVLKSKKYRWITNVHVTERKVVELANDGGRIRWKTENEGFNVQKNGIYGLTHEYSKDENAAKIFHIIMQIAHLWMQLLVKGSLIKHCFPRGIGSEKHVAFRLLEAWGNAHMTGEMLREVGCWRLQIRFCPDTS